MARIFEDPIDIDWQPERDGPPYRGTEAAHFVMRRVLNLLINPKPEISEGKEGWNLLDTISDERPPPAGLSTKPPDEATKVWLNAALDAEMKRDLDCEWDKVEERLRRANRREPIGPDEVEWQIAVSRASYTVGTDTKSDKPLLALLRDPATTTIPHWVREYLADRLEGRSPGQPPKTLSQRLEDRENWLAKRDVSRLMRLLRELYPGAPERARGGYKTVSKVAVEIAAHRWRIDDRTLKNFMGRGKNDKRHLQFKDGHKPSG
jgi:hypothetical protein